MVVWLRSLIPEPGTEHYPLFPAICTHQDVDIGDWWSVELHPIKPEALAEPGAPGAEEAGR